MRFERGVDPEAVPRGADRAARLMAEWCGARVLTGTAVAGAEPARRHIPLRASRVPAVALECRANTAATSSCRNRLVR